MAPSSSMETSSSSIEKSSPAEETVVDREVVAG
jgi:hypothetical protein